MNGVACGFIDLCPSHPAIQTKILSANYGEQCSKGSKGNANIDSIVLKLIHGEVSVLLNGDFEDFYPTQNECGPQRAMVNYYGDELHVTLYQISHHGGAILDFLLEQADVCTICKPGAGPGDAFYCGQHVYPILPLESRLQSEYTCGEDEEDERPYRSVTDNEFAIYTTTPNNSTINLIAFSTDGVRWGFNKLTLERSNLTN